MVAYAILEVALGPGPPKKLGVKNTCVYGFSDKLKHSWEG
jgi:hypothetical protein